MAITRADFPLPDVSDALVAPFFAGAAVGELRITRCGACGAYVWYPVADCPECGEPAIEWVAVSGRATLFSWAVVRRAFLPAFADRVPFVTALVALDEDPAVRLCTLVVDLDPGSETEHDFDDGFDRGVAALHADAPMEVVFRPLRFTTVPDREVVVPMFRLARADDS